MPKETTKVSIIIPAYNEKKELPNCLDSLLNQSFQNFEIIVVDDGSTDGTREIVREFAKGNKKIRLLKNGHQGPGLSRNLGAKNAVGEILVFVDADMTFEKRYLENLIGPFGEYPEIIGTTHSKEIAINTHNIWSLIWGKIRVEHQHKEWSERPTKLPGNIFRAIWKEKFLEVGGFDPAYGYADDQSLWLKHRLVPVLAENTLCYHKNPESLKEVYKQSRWIGASLDRDFLNRNLIKKVIPVILILFGPVALVMLILKKYDSSIGLRNLGPLILFIGVRSAGTFIGLIRKIYFGKNVR